MRYTNRLLLLLLLLLWQFPHKHRRIRKLLMARTANVNIQFAEVSVINSRKLHDEISVRRHVSGTRQCDCGAITHKAGVLTTDFVVSRCWCRYCRCHVAQTDDEIGRSESLTTATNFKYTAVIICWKAVQSFPGTVGVNHLQSSST